jgi:hypothetical protein
MTSLTWRAAAGLAGCGILSAVAWTNIKATGGLGTEHSYVVLAVAAGVAVGSVLSGLAWSAKRKVLAVLLVGCIGSGELFGLAQTAQRLVAAAEAMQAPLREHAIVHAAAVKRVADAKAAVDALPATSPRLDKAEAAKKAADAAVVGKAAEMGCRRECRALLDKAVDDAAAEVAAARAELSASGPKARGELEAARVALAGMTAPASATPLADRLGLPGWVLDLVTAALGSIAANGLAACLLVFASHAPRPQRQPRQRRPVAAKPAMKAAEVQQTEKPVSKPAKPRGKPRVKAARLDSSPLGRPRVEPKWLH